MAAPRDNRNAQKWTRSLVSGYLREIKRAAKNRNKFFLGKELTRLGLYKDIWAYWKRKFRDYESLIEQMALIEDQFEANLYRAALRSEISVKLAITCLRNAHRWRSGVVTRKTLIPTPTEMMEQGMPIARAA